MSGRPTPQMQVVLDALQELQPKPIETLSPEEARAQPLIAQAAMNLLQQRGLDVQEPVADVSERTIPGPDNTKLGLRLYTPEGEGPFPVLVYFHGGGFVIGGLDAYDASCRALCNAAGCIVVSVDYRLAPEHHFPAAVDDAYTATEWVIKHAAEFKGDPHRVAVGGESAGGNLAAVVCIMAKDHGGVPPVHQLLIYPFLSASLDFPSVEQHAATKPLNKAMLTWFLSHYLMTGYDKGSRYLAPLDSTEPVELPPATVILAEIDPLRDQGRAYAELLTKGGVQVEVREFQGVTHEFFGLRALVEEAREAVEYAAGRLREAFGARIDSGAASRAGVLPGLAVLGADGEKVGTVKAIHEDNIVVDRRLKRDVLVPYDAIGHYTGEVRLRIEAGKVDEMQWPHP